VPSTGRISDQPAVRPPSKTIRTSATVPRVRSRQHPQPEEEQQAGDPHPVGEQAADDSGGEQGAGDKDQLGVVSTHRDP
jgi:hypothetical protein